MDRPLVCLQATPEAIRTEKFNGRDHTVIPAIALVEGVIQCAICPEPEFISAQEFGKVADMWNGRPVTLNHPKVNDQFVSANSPDILEASAIGSIFNTKIEENKLKVEAWIDHELVENVEGAQEILDLIISGKHVELSTGYFADAQPTKGVFNGKTYDAIQKDLKPDHLAILNESQGACNWEMGCGLPRLNEAEICEECEEIIEKSPLRKLLEILKSKISFKDNAEMSDVDTRRALEAALPDSFVVAVFPNKVVYETFVEGKGFAVFERDFSIDDSGAITLNDEVTEVRPVTEFIPVIVNNEVDDMTVEEKVNGLIANEATNYTEDHREWLMALEETQLETMEPIVLEPPEEKPPVVNKEPDEKPDEEPDPPTAEGFIANAPEEIRSVLNEGLHMHREEKSEIIKALVGLKNCQFSEEELTAKDLPELRKLATFAKVEDFSGRGGPRPAMSDAESNVAVPPLVFEKKEAS